MYTRRAFMMPVVASVFLLSVFGCGLKPLPDSFFFEVSSDRIHRLPDTIVVEAARRTMELDEAFGLEFCDRFLGNAPSVMSGRPRYIKDTSWTLLEPGPLWLPKDLKRENQQPYKIHEPLDKWTEPSISFANKYPEFYENVMKRPILMRSLLYRKLQNRLFERNLTPNSIDSAVRTEK